jgi:hypothetical protein
MSVASKSIHTEGFWGRQTARKTGCHGIDQQRRFIDGLVVEQRSASRIHTPFNIANVTLFISISIFGFKKEFIV